jgi:hypothetical protein
MIIRYFLSGSGKMDREINTIYRPNPALSDSENKDQAMEAMAYEVRERHRNRDMDGVKIELWEELESSRYSRVMVNGQPVKD